MGHWFESSVAQEKGLTFIVSLFFIQITHYHKYMNALLFSINAVFPLILLSAFGFYIKNNGTVSEQFVKDGNKFCFKYAFMAMMFITIYKIESFAQIRWQVVFFALAVVLVLFFIGLIYIIFFVKDPKQKGVIHQAFYRSNYATIGLPLSFNIFGEEGLIVASLVSAFSVPLYNILGVISLSAFNEQKEKHLVIHIIKQIVKNPLIQGVALGMICLLIRPYTNGWRLSTSNFRFIYKAIDALGQIAPWLSLIILGAQFKFSSVKKLIKQISVSVIARLILAPSVGMIIVIFVPKLIGLQSFTGAEYAALFALFASPQAVASVSMADQMNGDSELAGQILVWTAVFSMFTLFLFTAFFKTIGIF